MFGLIGKSIILPVQNFCGGQKFWKELNFFRFLCTLGQRFSHFGRKRSGSALEIALYLTEKILEDKFPGTKFLSTFFRLWTEKFQTSINFLSKGNSHSSIFSLEQYVNGQKCLKDKSFTFLSEVWAKSFGTSDRIVEAVHSELHSTYPDRKFGGFCLSGNEIL